MLLEYHIDTKEEELYPSSIELRRRFAERKLQSAPIDDKTLISFKEANRSERREYGREVTSIVNTEISNRVALTRASHQLQLHKHLKNLEGDVARASRLSRTRLDALNDLEARIITLRGKLQSSREEPTVEQRVAKELSTNNKVQLEKMFTLCSRCKRKVLTQLFDIHNKACERLGGKGVEEDRPLVYDVSTDPVVELTTTLPQPPRNIKLVSKGCSHIEFVWEPPVFTGGLVITQYEIAYNRLDVWFDKESKMTIKKVVPQENILTNHFCLQSPVCHSGYKITQLQAGSIYMDFQLRCYNIRGPSDWVNMYSSNMITLDEADAPWVPLFFDITKITSTTIHLAWHPPFYDGGSPIVDYLVFYTVIERHISATSRNHMVPVDHKLKIGSNATSFVIRHLPSSTDVKDIKIKPINAANLVGEAAVITLAGGTVTTKECSRCIAIRKELETVLKNPNEFIDTDFYSAAVQRMHKKDYIAKLKKEMATVRPTDEEYEEEKIWRQIKAAKKAERLRMEAEQKAADEAEMSSDEDEAPLVPTPNRKQQKQQDFTFPYRVRKKHYKHRLQHLENLIQSLTKEKSDIESTRIELTALMNDKQKRLIELELERDRAMSFSGEKITSSVLQGVMMTYLIATFKHDLDKTWEECLASIAHMKHTIITGEKRKIEIIEKIAETKAEWQEKIAAFAEFTKKNDVKQKAMHRLVHGSTREELLRKHFNQIRKFTSEQLALKRQIAKAFHNVEKRFLASAFERWSTGRFGNNSELLATTGGAGSAMLQRARDYRIQVQSALRETIAFTTEIQHKLTIAKWNKTQRDTLIHSDHLKEMEEGMSQVTLESRGMHFLYEGDGYALENKFVEAENCYEAQIISLRSIKPVNIKLLAICHGRLGKLFLRQERFDRAILEFDRQLSLAKEIDNKVEYAEAYFGLGTGYLGKFDYLEAIRYLEIAHGRYDILGHLAKKCGAMVVLKECYSRLNKEDLVELYGDKISAIENELRTKLSTINEKLEDMTLRLRKTAAVVEFEIPIERIGLRTLQLREQISDLHGQLAELEAELDEQKLVTGNIERLLEDIQGELNLAAETDDLEMMSYLVHDQPQMIDVEEVKSRLHQRRLQVLEDFKKEKQIENSILTRIKNTEDNIQAAETDLAVENGVLMTHSRQNKPFRCMVFDPANAAGDEVTGIATGGVENFVASESNNIHVIDFHNGELLQMFVGDERDKFGEERHGHTAIVTCLAYDNNRIYSGSMDETIMVWSVLEKKRVMVITGHDGSVVSLAIQGAILFSGGADTTVRMWNKTTGYQIRIITGHTQSVLSIQAGPTWMVTASADEEVRVWDIKPKAKGVSVETKMRLIGHETAVTVAKYGKLEVVSGDKLGTILIWMLENGEIVRRIKAHKGAILTLQFDATRVVSGGADGNVCVSDIGTGEVLQTLYGHTAHVLALAFDTQRILTVGRDNVIRYWSWGGQKAEPPDKYHVMSKSDTLLSIANQYKIEMSQLMAWNGITAVRQCYSGMRLIVRKGNADKKTAAEVAAEEKARKNQHSAALTKKRMQQNMVESGNTFGKYNRVYKLATDIDTFSLGNRLFGKEKRQNELFPEKTDVDVDKNSLSYRLRRDVQKASAGHHLGARYFPSADNEDEWGHVADALGASMLDMFVEHMAYEVFLELRKSVRDPLSIYGRITAPENEKQEKTRAQAQSRGTLRRKKLLRQQTGSVEEVADTEIAPIAEEEETKSEVSDEGERGGRIESSDSERDDD